MARRLRVEFAGALYHVIVRGNERRDVFRDDSDREGYLRRLERYRERFEFRLLAFCLMSNHVHLAVEAGSVPLSRVMLALQSSYTQAFNRRHRRVGHLFQGRYKAFLVDADRYFVALIRYIHRNPVEAGLAERPEDYAWSSDRYYRRGKGPEWLDLDRGYFLLGARRVDGPRRYRDLTREAGSVSYEELGTTAQIVKGDEAFAAQVMGKVEVPELIRRSLRVERIARLVAESEGLDLESLQASSRRRGVALARALTGYLGKTCGRIPYVRTAAFFNRDGSTLAKDILRLEGLLLTSPKLRRRAAELSQRLIENARIQA
jgi:REP element-mobilizing transposase RayT